VVKTIGDAVMATFETPDRAIAAAIRMREAMSDLGAERQHQSLRLKMGIHEGSCLAVTLNGQQDYFGQTVNIASRVQGRRLVCSDPLEQLARLRQELLGVVKGATTTEGRRGSVLDLVPAILPNGGAIVVPILTHVGSKILVVTREVRSRDRSTQSEVANQPSLFPSSSPSEAPRQSITVLNLPELTVSKVVDTVVRPNGKVDWLLAYHINYLQGAEQDRLWPQWLAAIDNLGPELWRLFGARVEATLKDRGVKRGARLVWLPPGLLGILPLSGVVTPFLSYGRSSMLANCAAVGIVLGAAYVVGALVFNALAFGPAPKTGPAQT
jgi:hypothetical protein